MIIPNLAGVPSQGGHPRRLAHRLDLRGPVVDGLPQRGWSCGEGEGRSDSGFETRNIHSSFLQDRYRDAALLLEQSEQDMRALEFRMRGFRSDTLRGLQGLLHFLSGFFKSHGGVLMVKAP